MFRAVLATAILAVGAQAGELEVGVYGGFNESAHANGTLSNGVVSQVDTIKWLGNSFDMPIYYGVKATYWPEQWDGWGFGVDFTHSKAFADIPGSGIAGTYSVLEFTDGLNQLTVNAFRKFDFDNGFRAYAGAGVGIGIPHVEVVTTAGSILGATSTLEYQVTGGVVQAVAGTSYEVLDDWRVFGEYKLSYSWNQAKLSGGVGTFSANLVTHNVSVGVTHTFDFMGY